MSRLHPVGLLTLIGVLAISGAAGAQYLPEKPRIQGFCSTGETFDGWVTRDDEIYFYLDDSSGVEKVCKRNILELHVSVPAALKIPAAKWPARWRNLVHGKYLLDAGRLGLAEELFALAVESDPDLVEHVHWMYRTAELSIPQRFLAEGTMRFYIQAEPGQIEKNRIKAGKWGDMMRAIAPNTHRIETPHFVIYSSWNRADDRALRNLHERFYQLLCREFGIGKDENIWIGKLPVYLFWDRQRFKLWMNKTVRMPLNVEMAGGAIQHGYWQCLAIGPVHEFSIHRNKNRTFFYEVLVHEATHAFLGRYINDTEIPVWLNEGLAQLISSRLVKNTTADFALRKAKRKAVRGELDDIQPLLRAKRWKLDIVAYGVAYGVTEYLIEQDIHRFRAFLRKIKEGLSGEDALKEIYGYDYVELEKRWRQRARWGDRVPE